MGQLEVGGPVAHGETICFVNTFPFRFLFFLILTCFNSQHQIVTPSFLINLQVSLFRIFHHIHRLNISSIRFW